MFLAINFIKHFLTASKSSSQLIKNLPDNELRFCSFSQLCSFERWRSFMLVNAKLSGWHQQSFPLFAKVSQQLFPISAKFWLNSSIWVLRLNYFGTLSNSILISWEEINSNFIFFFSCLPRQISGLHYFWWDFGVCDHFWSNQRDCHILSSWINLSNKFYFVLTLSTLTKVKVTVSGIKWQRSVSMGRIQINSFQVVIDIFFAKQDRHMDWTHTV